MGSIGWAQTSWTYSDTDKTVTDGKWVIAVTAHDSAAGTMTLGSITTESGDGVLDLRDMVVGDVAITGLTFPGSEAWKSAAIKELYVNNVVGEYVPSMLKYNTTVQVVELASDTIEKITTEPRPFENCSALGKVVLKCPNLLSWAHAGSATGSPFSGTVVSNAFHDVVNPGVTNINGNGMFTGMTKMKGPVILTNLVYCSGDPFYGGGGSPSWSKLTDIWIKWPFTYGLTMGSSFGALTNFIYDAPNVRSCGTMMGFSVLAQDVGTLVPPYVQTIGRWSLNGANKVYGTLVLTNLVLVSTGGKSSRSSAFSCGAVTAAEIRGPVTNLPYTILTTTITNLVLQLPNVTNVCKSAFKMKEKGVITIYGKPWAYNQMTNLLMRVDGNKVSKLTLKVSKKQGWKEYAKDYGDDFPKESRPEGCFGVWREPNGTGTRGAWMVHFPQPDDPTGLCIRVQ
jgi:hypothetical protein